MQSILQAKVKDCQEFCDALLNSENVIAKAVLFWATGLHKQNSWPGKNKISS